jgi:hypothetical protein
MTREQIEAIRARLAGVFGPHGDGLAAAPSLAADVSALLEEVERLTAGLGDALSMLKSLRGSEHDSEGAITEAARELAALLR